MSIPDGFFYIKSRLSGKVVDVDGASMKADAKILLWPQKFDSDRDNQLWYYDDGYLVNKKSRKVLDIRGDGARHFGPRWLWLGRGRG
ncbi:hypothetical protein BC938DRAFT_482881 [Jimgerdemannia flammicorona]|uniref:Ricin B lectin domain-containing protein n=1 Tax=Jimgerdemannia flammicorona TaxID=994334 RepID=A0A433QD14_9FUNG|nr:hypothetical protein BC938DRAFT_482881 [Jimgerdemannia flammicorona]